jgi:hypothetical protein
VLVPGIHMLKYLGVECFDTCNLSSNDLSKKKMGVCVRTYRDEEMSQNTKYNCDSKG